MEALIIRELPQAMRADFQRFFGRRAFAENPEWAACYYLEASFFGPDDAPCEQPGFREVGASLSCGGL